MNLRKYRWSRNYESAEEELIQLLLRKHISAERWIGEPYQEFAEHSHGYTKQLWCAEGSIVITVGDKSITLQTGDALDLPSGAKHSALVGFSGCAMYEAHRIDTMHHTA